MMHSRVALSRMGGMGGEAGLCVWGSAGQATKPERARAVAARILTRQTLETVAWRIEQPVAVFARGGVTGPIERCVGKLLVRTLMRERPGRHVPTRPLHTGRPQA